MTIQYRKKYVRADLYFGITYLLLGSSGFFFDTNVFISYGFSFIGALYLIQYFYKSKYPYIKIEDNILRVNIIFQPKEIDLSQITRIKKFADEITFLTPHERLKISTKLIAKEDFPHLEKTLSNLTLEPERNPFKKEIFNHN